jgi:hypothetical protein
MKDIDFIRHQDITYLDIREGVGSCTKTPPLPFNLGLSNIQKMFSSSKKLAKSTRLKCRSPLTFKHQFNVNQCFHVATMVLFQWMPHLALMT